ncbi:DNA repair protein complementing XP-C cells-like [Ptychodera flava]|uniref:DNA repair protein complementing XP-C cells-like n=1 Tax=Ptychodera flava TaxID=63121 RepID=UPI00396A4919
MAKRKGSRSCNSREANEPPAKRSKQAERGKMKKDFKRNVTENNTGVRNKASVKTVSSKRNTRTRKVTKCSSEHSPPKPNVESIPALIGSPDDSGNDDVDGDMADFTKLSSAKIHGGRDSKSAHTRRRGEERSADVQVSVKRLSPDLQQTETNRSKKEPKKGKISQKADEKGTVKKRQKRGSGVGKKIGPNAGESEHAIQSQVRSLDIQSPDAHHKDKLPGRDLENDVTMTTDDRPDGASSDDSESEWEEVEEIPAEQVSPKKSQVTPDSVEITVDLPNALRMKRKRKKKEFDFMAYFQRQINRYNKEQRIEMHMVHLLCLLANGFYRNTCCNDNSLKAMALSVIPNDILKKAVRQYDVATLTRVVKWFKSTFEISAEVEGSGNVSVDVQLMERFETNMVSSEEELVHIFVVILRVLKLDVRLVISLQPMAYKQLTSQSKGPAKRRSSKKNKSEESESSPVSDKASDAKGDERSKAKKACERMKSGKKRAKKSDEASTSRQSLDQSVQDSPVRKRVLRPKNDRKRHCDSKAAPIIDIDSDDEDLSEEDKYIASSESESDWSEQQERTKPVRTPKQRQRHVTGQGSSGKGQKSKTKKRDSTDSSFVELSSDSDFEVEVVAMATGPRRSAEKKKQRKRIISSDSEKSVEIVKTKNIKDREGSDQWIEVYLPSDEKWVCVDCVRNSVNHPEHCEKYATQPLNYVLAFDNDNTVKDVTCRYASKWMSHTRKQRVDDEWWEETLSPYQPCDTDRNESEDMALQAQLQQQPLPTSIAEYKNHPLYALRRHLLKFEAFYPENPATLGFCRGEPVYARECVHTLHTRETWLKEGRVVRLGEDPYKMVKARPKPRKSYKDLDKPEESQVPVFGRWQTEEYISPPAVDGKVPRNEHGNVEMYLPRMLPKGTVHLQIPGLNRVARKLDIDCAPAMVGWDFHSGFSHPQFDGFIVCEEYKETLLDAWEHEQQEIERKAREKREKRVMQHWKLLIKGLLIRERLKRRFQTDEHDGKSTSDGAEDGEVARDVAMSWPLNKQAARKKTLKKKEEPSSSHLFPFEKL